MKNVREIYERGIEMKLKSITMLGIACAVFMTACGKELSTEEFMPDSTEYTESGEDISWEPDWAMQEIIGGLMHGANWAEDEENYSFTYGGGELEIPYMMIGSGICRNTGFLLYLNGVPQPYKIKGQEEDYRYMHIIEGGEDTEEDFVFCFVPVTGNSGDQMTLSINSISNPAFLPDMVETFDYGMSHGTIEAAYRVSFWEDAKEQPEGADVLNLVSGAELVQSDIDKEEKAYMEESKMETKLDLEHKIYSDLRMDGESMELNRKFELNGKDTVHISYVMMGHPGIRYRVSFYLDHRLLTDGEQSVYEVELETGKMTTVEFDLDASAITDSSFYAMAVPVNAEDYPEEVFSIMKYNTIHMYRGKTE